MTKHDASGWRSGMSLNISSAICTFSAPKTGASGSRE